MFQILSRLKKFYSAHRNLHLISMSLLIACGSIVFLPGISGPFIFDDYPNIVANDALRIQHIGSHELYQAAYSVPAVSYLQRPLAYISFALNGYFSGSFENSTPFKLTNLFIHTTNALLVFWMLQLVFKRCQRSSPASSQNGRIDSGVTIYLAAATSALWFVHPIQITSVLYVVQRMTSLSATFILLGILSYLIGRERLIKRYRYSYLYIFIGPFIFGLIGIFIKETAALLPVFILALEATLYSNEKPWRNWTLLSQRRRKTIIVSAILAGLFIALAIGYWFVISILPGYDGRMFTPKERLLTESRILLFYISLILLPRSNQFGVHHDDIALSSSIFSPWTTLPAVLTLVSAIFLALYIRKRRPLISLGILWFLTGHLLESSIIPLELVHEHRNYLASLGIVIILIQLIYVGSRYIGNNKLLLLLPLLVLVYGSVALSRANQWSSYESLISYNAIHHPRSARAQLELGGMYAQQGRFREAQSAYLAAIKYQPHDPGLLIGLQLIRAHQGLAPDSRVDQLIVSLIHSYPLNATFFRTLRHAAECVQTLCSGINRSLEMWVNTLLNQETADSKRSRYYYYLATSLISQSRTRDAIAAYRKSYDLDRENISALLSLADLYIHLGHLEEAGLTLKYAEKSIETLTQSDRKEITALHNRIKSLGHSKH